LRIAALAFNLKKRRDYENLFGIAGRAWLRQRKSDGCGAARGLCSGRGATHPLNGEFGAV
jgi:hypothetical protein